MSKNHSITGFEKTVLALTVALCCHGVHASYEDDQRQLQAARTAMSQNQNDGTSETQTQVQRAAVSENTATAAGASEAHEVQPSSAANMPRQGPAVDASQSAQNNTTSLTATLLKQAYFWHDKKLHNKAMQTLTRLLMADPHHEKALFLMSL